MNGGADKPRARRLKTIAAWINDNLPELGARVERVSTQNYRKAGRLIYYTGPRIYGNLLQVFRRPRDGAGWGPFEEKPILRHDATETYRSNDEVERWLADYVEGCHRGRHWPERWSASACRVCRIDLPVRAAKARRAQR